MNFRNSVHIGVGNHLERYGRISQLLHWLMAACIILMLGLGLLLDDIPGSWKGAAIDFHKSLGIVLLGLVCFRCYWKLTQHQPGRSGDVSRLQEVAAGTSHFLLYILMLAMPLSGWAMSSAFGKPVMMFEWGPLPDIIERNRDLGVALKNLHGWLAYGLLVLIALHVGAAFYHHFIRKDDVLKRMLPKRFARE